MSCSDGVERRIVTLEVADGEHEDYTFTSTPLADVVLTVTAGDGGADGAVYVTVFLSADALAYEAAWGVGLPSAGGAAWTVPRATAAIRCAASGGPATYRLSILEAA